VKQHQNGDPYGGSEDPIILLYVARRLTNVGGNLETYILYLPAASTGCWDLDANPFSVHKPQQATKIYTTILRFAFFSRSASGLSPSLWLDVCLHLLCDVNRLVFCLLLHPLFSLLFLGLPKLGGLVKIV
jgi:hypothetical protein